MAAATPTGSRRSSLSVAFNAAPILSAVGNDTSSFVPAALDVTRRSHPQHLRVAATTTTIRHPLRTRRSPVMQVERIETGTLRNIIPRTNPDQQGHPVLVFSFVTANCRACKYASAGFARLAQEFEGRRTHRAARFLQVDVSDIRNQRLGQHLGVTAVPSFQLFAYKQESPQQEEPQQSYQQMSTRNQSNSLSNSNVGSNNEERSGPGAGAFGILDELVGARVVGQVRDRLLHYCSDDFNLDDYVFDDSTT